MARDPPLPEVTLPDASFETIAINKVRSDDIGRFSLVFPWPVAIPAHMVEHFAVFPKASGDDAFDDIFLMVIVLQHAGVVPVCTGRGHRVILDARGDE